MESFNSQEWQDYCNESICIEDAKTDDDSQDSDKAIDADGDSDFSWLRDVGITFEDDKEIGEDVNLLFSLNRRQASTVRKKIANANATLRKRRAFKSRLPDVRDVFLQQTSESSSSVTRSRSATPNSLDSLSPCQTPPSPDWPQNIIQDIPSSSPSSSASQGYHSAYRDDVHLGEAQHPYGYMAADKSRRRSLEPEFMNVFKHDEVRHDRQANSVPKDGPVYRYRVPKSYDLTHALQDNESVEVLGYQLTGSLSTPRGEPLKPLISESEITISFNDDDVEPDNKLDWGFEAVACENNNDDSLEFYEISEKFGVTSISDLSAIDVKRVQTISLIELTILFDNHNIRFNRRKDKKRRKDDNLLFGLPLTTILENDRKSYPGCKVPVLLDKIVCHLRAGLHEEGLLRVPGSMAKIQILKTEIDETFRVSPEKVDEALRSSCANDVAGLLKLFLRQLPVPILTNEYMDAFYQVGNIPDKMDMMKVLKLLILLMNDIHRNTLRLLLDFLAEVAENEEHNRMTLQNISMVMAPNLFVPRKLRGDSKRDIDTEIKIANITSRLTKLLITYRQIFWTVPGFMIRQIRDYNENALRRNPKENNSNPMKWLLPRKQKAEIYRKINNEVDFQEGRIRVSAPQLSYRTICVKLTDAVTCADVIRTIFGQCAKSFGPNRKQQANGLQSSSSKQPLTVSMQGNVPTLCRHIFDNSHILLRTHFLFEVGGNIGERRLRRDAVVMGIYQQNPNADWVLRCCHP